MNKILKALNQFEKKLNQIQVSHENHECPLQNSPTIEC